MTERAHALAALAGWILATWGAAEILTPWIWPLSLGTIALGGVGVRSVCRVVWVGWLGWKAEHEQRQRTPKED